MSDHTRLYIIAAIGGGLPIFVQYLAEIKSRGEVVSPDEFLIFLFIVFSFLGLLSHFITSRSREFAALIGGIAAPSLFFALATGTKLGSDAKETVRLSNFNIVSRAHAFGGGGGDGGGGSDIPRCINPDDYVVGSYLNIPEELIKNRNEIEIEFWPESRDGHYWMNRANLFYIIAYERNGHINRCSLRVSGVFSYTYIDGYLKSIQISGSSNRVLLENSAAPEAVALEITANLSMPFLDGIWWRLGGIAVPKIDITSYNFYSEEDYNEHRRNRLLESLRKGTL